APSEIFPAPALACAPASIAPNSNEHPSRMLTKLRFIQLPPYMLCTTGVRLAPDAGSVHRLKPRVILPTATASPVSPAWQLQLQCGLARAHTSGQRVWRRSGNSVRSKGW